MKKILALVLALCMAVGFCVSCSSPAEDFYDESYDYIVDLADAIEAGDEDEVKSISEDIADWAEDFTKETNEMSAEEQKEFQEEMEEAEKEYEEKFNELEDEYDKKVLEEAMMVYTGAIMEGSMRAQGAEMNF